MNNIMSESRSLCTYVLKKKWFRVDICVRLLCGVRDFIVLGWNVERFEVKLLLVILYDFGYFPGGFFCGFMIQCWVVEGEILDNFEFWIF